MTDQSDCALLRELMEQIQAKSTEAILNMIRILINEAMRLEREKHLGSSSY